MSKIYTQKLDYCNAKILRYENYDVALQSYATVVLFYRHADITLKCTGLYSRTTINHIGRFLRREFKHLNYYDIKALVRLGPDWSIYKPYSDEWVYRNEQTGEILEKLIKPKSSIFKTH